MKNEMFKFYGLVAGYAGVNLGDVIVADRGALHPQSLLDLSMIRGENSVGNSEVGANQGGRAWWEQRRLDATAEWAARPEVGGASGPTCAAKAAVGSAVASAREASSLADFTLRDVVERGSEDVKQRLAALAACELLIARSASSGRRSAEPERRKRDLVEKFRGLKRDATGGVIFDRDLRALRRSRDYAEAVNDVRNLLIRSFAR